MKTFFLLCLISMCSLAFAQSETYTPPLPPTDSEFALNIRQAIDKMDKAMNLQQMQEAAEAFTALNTLYPDEWLAPYYAGYSYTLMALLEENNSLKDTHLGKGQAMLDIAKALAPNNAEILVAQTYLYQMRVEVDLSLIHI